MMRDLSTPDAVLNAMAASGGGAYFGEPVTVLEHSLQSAWFVQRQRIDTAIAGPALIAAALLHDLGHLLHNNGEDAANRGLDTRHEELAAELLAGHLPDEVLEPIRLHVAAKRYLCQVNPRYFASLSPASVQSLSLQGGPMAEAEAQAFLVLPHARAAIALRHADDAAKVRGLAVPLLESYRPLLVSLWC